MTGSKLYIAFFLSLFGYMETFLSVSNYSLPWVFLGFFIYR
jgi:hypothetical protein